MNVKNIKFLLVSLVISLSVDAYAIQLGKVIFKSNQNSPLDVSIKVNLSSEDKINLLKPTIASQENYESQGIERTKIHNDIVLSLTSKNPKEAILRLTSQIPVTESFLDLLIQIESPGGKVLKEYTVLLDPPSSVIPKKKAQKKKTIKKEISIKNKSEKIKKTETKKISQKKTSPKTGKKKKIVTAKPGKTLFQIARENSIAGVTTEQIVIAIYQLNPKSFDGNLNGLIRDKKLKLPLNEYYKKLSHLEARKILKQENIAWKSITGSKKLKKPKKIKNKVVKNKVVKNKVSDELTRLRKELEIVNNKLLEKNKKLKAIQTLNKSTIKPKETETKFSEIVQDSELKKAKSKAQENIQVPIKKNSIVIIDSLNEELSKPFISSITDQNQNIIQEVIIDDEEINNSIKPIFVLLLIFLLTLLLGLLLLVKKRKKEINNNHFSGLSDTFEPNVNSFDNDEEFKSESNDLMRDKIDSTDFSNQDINNSASNKNDELK